MEMNEKQLRMINEALTTHIDRLLKLSDSTQDHQIKAYVVSQIADFRNLQSDIEVLLLIY